MDSYNFPSHSAVVSIPSYSNHSDLVYSVQSSTSYNSDIRGIDYYKSYSHDLYHLNHNNLRNELQHRQDSIQYQYPNLLYSQYNPWQSFDNGCNLPNYSIPLQKHQKQKRARMSLQKRLLVNARERERMRVLNKAFESLRDVLPCYIADGHMAKITTLRLAINYIKALTDLLNEQKDEDSQKENSVSLPSEKSQDDMFSAIVKETQKDNFYKTYIKSSDVKTNSSNKMLVIKSQD